MIFTAIEGLLGLFIVLHRRLHLDNALGCDSLGSQRRHSFGGDDLIRVLSHRLLIQTDHRVDFLLLDACHCSRICSSCFLEDAFTSENFAMFGDCFVASFALFRELDKICVVPYDLLLVQILGDCVRFGAVSVEGML